MAARPAGRLRAAIGAMIVALLVAACDVASHGAAGRLS